MDSSATHPSQGEADAWVLRIWRTGIDESRAGEYREFARRDSVPMFSSQPGFLGVFFAAAPRERAVVTLWESRAAAEALEASHSYRRTVAAIETAGFLDGESHVELFELHGAFVGEHCLDALGRTDEARHRC
jgi:heme-degrading monooxygenase HmoA